MAKMRIECFKKPNALYRVFGFLMADTYYLLLTTYYLLLTTYYLLLTTNYSKGAKPDIALGYLLGHLIYSMLLA